MRRGCVYSAPTHTLGFYWAISYDFLKLISYFDTCVSVYIFLTLIQYGLFFIFGLMAEVENRKKKAEWEAKWKQCAAARSVKFWLFEISFRKIHFRSIFLPSPFLYLSCHPFLLDVIRICRNTFSSHGHPTSLTQQSAIKMMVVKVSSPPPVPLLLSLFTNR